MAWYHKNCCLKPQSQSYFFRIDIFWGVLGRITLSNVYFVTIWSNFLGTLCLHGNSTQKFVCFCFKFDWCLSLHLIVMVFSNWAITRGIPPAWCYHRQHRPWGSMFPIFIIMAFFRSIFWPLEACFATNKSMNRLEWSFWGGGQQFKFIIDICIWCTT